MKPFLVTPLDAGRLPRWILPLLCAAYIVAGLFGRDPWRNEDAAGFGIAHTMATGSAIDWLLPNIQGVLIADDGPLPFWLGAVAMRAASLLNGIVAATPGAPVDGGYLPPDFTFRFAAALGLTLTLVLTWYAAYGFARRPELQPDDPLGASASRKDFGRAVADSTLLATLATFGLIARVHETTADAAQTTWVALFLFGMSLALDRPRSGGAIVGLAIGATLLTRGIPLAVVLLACVVVALVAVRAYRLIAVWLLSGLVPALLLAGLAWPLGLLMLAGEWSIAGLSPSIADAARIEVVRFLEFWFASNGYQISGPGPASLGYLIRTVPWFFWPLWPFLLWTLWRWRGSRLEAPLAVPATMLVLIGTLSLLDPEGSESSLLPMVLPMTFLAALALPTIRRSLVSLIDWFAVAAFSVVGLAVWAYWIAVMTGVPARMAEKARLTIPGFDARLSYFELALGIVATLTWLLLVAWRISRRPRAFWRPMALSSGGLVLAWLLLMTLWLPAANYRKSYRDLASQVRPMLAGARCVSSQGLDAGQRALFAYYAAARFRRLPALDGTQAVSDQAACPWLLISDREDSPHNAAALSEGWRRTWEGQRPVYRGERLHLYRRTTG